MVLEAHILQNNRHSVNFLAFTRLRRDFGFVLLILNMIIHMSFTSHIHVLSANVWGPENSSLSEITNPKLTLPPVFSGTSPTWPQYVLALDTHPACDTPPLFRREPSVVPVPDELRQQASPGPADSGTPGPQCTPVKQNTIGHVSHPVGHLCDCYHYAIIKSSQFDTCYNMTVWILAGNYISFTIAAGLIRLHMPGVRKSRV